MSNVVALAAAKRAPRGRSVATSRLLLVGLMLLGPVLAGCGEETPGSDVEPCTVGEERCVLTHDFGSYSLTAGEEIDGICFSWTLNNDEELWVNAVGTKNDGYFHHSNWFFVPEEEYALPDGHWNCWDNNFSELDAAWKGGVLYAQSTQTDEEEQRFVEGAAVRIPARSRIIAYSHLLNPSGDAVETGVRVSLDTLPKEEVTAPLTPFRLNYVDLQIAPQARSEFSGHCEIASAFETAMGAPFDMKLHYILPHYHALGDSFRLATVGGERDGETLFESNGLYAEPLGHRFDQPLDLAADGAVGISFTCGYDNPRDETVGFGIGDQEMCVMLGFTESGLLFDGAVNQTETVGPDSEGVIQGTGPCQVIGVKFDDGS